MTSIAVVILNFNGEKLLRQFLPSVVRNSTDAQIFVADNGSSDQSVQLVRERFSEVTLLELGKNYGFCEGYNKALKQITSDYYVLLNSDVEVTPAWLTPLKTLLDSNTHIAAVQPKILSWKEKHLFEYAGAGGGFIDRFGYPFCRGRVFDHVEEDRGQYDDERPVFWASGACMMIRAEKFHEHGGFDNDLFAHMEEIDLCWKLNRSKSLVYYSGRSHVYHLGAGTLGYRHPQKTYLNFRNGLILIFKHMDTGELFYKLPLRIAFDWLAALFFVFKGEGKSALSVLQAHLAFFKQLQGIRSKRNRIRSRHPSYPRKNVYSGVIISDYYLHRKQSIPLQ
jgi:GT2 family glycosyltransferase